MYDNENIFAKILRNEIPCDKIYEDDISLFFKDINPQAKIHILGVPKIPCVDYSDFIKNADTNLINSFFLNLESVLQILKVKENGYRIVTNSGVDGGQEVPHFHIHILAGEKIK